jgi:hypothetical protein
MLCRALRSVGESLSEIPRACINPPTNRNARAEYVNFSTHLVPALYRTINRSNSLAARERCCRSNRQVVAAPGHVSRRHRPRPPKRLLTIASAWMRARRRERRLRPLWTSVGRHPRGALTIAMREERSTELDKALLLCATDRLSVLREQTAGEPDVHRRRPGQARGQLKLADGMDIPPGSRP